MLPNHISDTAANSQDGSSLELFRMQESEGCGYYQYTLRGIFVPHMRDFVLVICIDLRLFTKWSQ